eukprot:1141301-Pelagomonas_calceolata.AAC.5
MTAFLAAGRGAVERIAVGQEGGGVAGTGRGVAWCEQLSVHKPGNDAHHALAGQKGQQPLWGWCANV